MNRSAPIICLLTLVALTGCATTPQARWYQQRQLLTTANTVFLATRHRMSDRSVIKYGEYLLEASAILDLSKGLLPGGGAQFDDYLDLIETILLKVNYESEAPDGPSDDPSGTPVGPIYLEVRNGPIRDGSKQRRVERGSDQVDLAQGGGQRQAGRRRGCGSKVASSGLRWLNGSLAA